MLRPRDPIQFPHFINKETGVQRQEVTYFGLHRCSGTQRPVLILPSHTLGFQNYWELYFAECQTSSYGTLHSHCCNPFCLLSF